MIRRAALGALGAALLSGCGAGRAVVRAAERGHGCVDTPVPEASEILVMDLPVHTRHVATRVRCSALVLPKAPKSGRVVYVLPGRGSNASDAVNLGLDGFFAAYLRAGGPPFLLAILDAGESYFHPRVSGEDRLAVATIDLPNAVRPLLHGARPREALIGMSMGGYGALLAAEREPERYRAVAVAGPAIFPSYEDERGSVGDAFDSAADFARYDVIAHASALRGRRVRIRCGEHDPFLPGVRAFARACPTADVRVQAGCHDDGFWRTSAPSLLEFVGRHL